MLKDRISDLNPRQPVAVPSETPVKEVLRLMVDRRIGSVLVVDDGQLSGIFSERDALVRLNTDFHDLRELPVGKFMTPGPSTLQTHNKIIFAVHKMAIGGYRHIPIVEGGRPIGVISIRDILRYTTEKLQAIGK
ncbi:MAG: CBS domain-containing protein [Planctomycetales bacterium]